MGFSAQAVLGAVLFASVIGTSDAAPSSSEQLDELDRQEFRGRLETVYRCIQARDINCINQALKSAHSLASSADDRRAVQNAAETARQAMAALDGDEAAIRARAEQERAAMEARAEQTAQRSEAQRQQIIRDANRETNASAARNHSREPGTPLAQGLQNGLSQLQRDYAQVAETHNRAMQNTQQIQAERAKQSQSESRTGGSSASPSSTRTSRGDVVASASPTQRKAAESYISPVQPPITRQDMFPKGPILDGEPKKCPPGSVPSTNPQTAPPQALCVRDPAATAVAASPPAASHGSKSGAQYPTSVPVERPIPPKLPELNPRRESERGGASAHECVDLAIIKGGMRIENNCRQPVFVLYCGDLKYSKSTCGSTPNYYTHSFNSKPGESSQTSEVALKDLGNLRIAACFGQISFGNDGHFVARPDGSYTCLKR